VVLPDDLERDVFIGDDGRLSFRGGEGDARTIVDHGYLIPGLVDVHAHLTMASPAGDDAPEPARSEASARAQLEGGVLLLREPGGATHSAVSLGPSGGFPRTQSAGRWLAAPGGFLPGFAHEVAGPRLIEAAREELAGGGGWVKLIGDWPFESGRAPSFRPEELAGVVEDIHTAGGRVAIHAILPETVEMAVASGCDSIEHGTYASADMVETMADRGIALTPTIGAVEEPLPDSASDEQRTWKARAAASVREMVRMAWEAGVTLLAGTDVALAHGRVWREIVLLSESGMPPVAALAAGSWRARAFLGLPGIEEGAPADLVVFDHDPRDDLFALAEPSMIVLDGRVMKGAG
jgi:imidazolonepropionase-like amidohydrolase